MRSLSTVRAFALPIALAVAFTPLIATAAPGRAQTIDSATRIDEYLRGRMPDLRTPGLSVVVVDGEQVLLSRGYGFADREAGTPMTEDTPVARYLPDFSMDDGRAAGITVRQVLSHTSGIPAGTATDGAQDHQALQRRVASLASVKLRYAPGRGYEYSLDGYSVAGLIVQTVSGLPYEDYLATHVFEPLGMARTTFDLSRAAELGSATGYAKSRGVVSAGPLPLSRAANPGGGVLSTARDVGNYFVALLNGGAFGGTQVISPASIDQLWTPEPASGAEAYGLGWGVEQVSGMRVLSHAGDLGAPGAYGGSGSRFVLVPERRLAVGVLANMSSLEKAEVAQNLLTIVLGGEPVTRPVPPDWRQTTFTPDRTVWASYLGEYQSPQPIRVYQEGDKLLGAARGITIAFVP